MADVRSVHVRIEGRVQGVGFRVWAENAAIALGLSGWVQNRRDGSVEAVFQGAPEDVAEMLERCETGPPAACVDHVERLGEEAQEFTDFEVRPTG